MVVSRRKGEQAHAPVSSCLQVMLRMLCAPSTLAHWYHATSLSK